jgi:hypothetical protein
VCFLVLSPVRTFWYIVSLPFVPASPQLLGAGPHKNLRAWRRTRSGSRYHCGDQQRMSPRMSFDAIQYISLLDESVCGHNGTQNSISSLAGPISWGPRGDATFRSTSFFSQHMFAIPGSSVLILTMPLARLAFRMDYNLRRARNRYGVWWKILRVSSQIRNS